MKDKVIPVLVVMIIVAAFAVGLLYGKVSVYEKGGVAGAKTAEAGQNQGDTGTAPQAQPTDSPQLTQDQWQQVMKAATRTEGKENAKVVMAEFTDFQCPFCSRYYTDSYKQIKKEYIDTGKIKYMLFDLTLPFHPNAKPAALAARCAGDQGKFWEMHSVLFDKQTAWSEATAPKDTFAGYAKDIGLNTNTFTTCFDSGKYNQALDDDMALAQKVGASGTPTFFVNGERIVGAQPYSTFKATLDKALAAQ